MISLQLPARDEPLKILRISQVVEKAMIESC